jgi:hypothetical protein
MSPLTSQCPCPPFHLKALTVSRHFLSPAVAVPPLCSISQLLRRSPLYRPNNPSTTTPGPPKNSSPHLLPVPDEAPQINGPMRRRATAVTNRRPLQLAEQGKRRQNKSACNLSCASSFLSFSLSLRSLCSCSLRILESASAPARDPAGIASTAPTRPPRRSAGTATTKGSM